MKDKHLSRIETQWNVVKKAGGSDFESEQARALLIEQYGPAAKRYLLGALRNQEAAEEVFQEFALRMLRGDLKNADSNKGRFRNFVKTTLYHLIIDHHRRQKRNAKYNQELDVDFVAATDSETTEGDDPFLLAWRESLLDNAWSRLDQLEQETGRPYYSVLKLRVESPHLTTKQLRSKLADCLEEVPSEATLRVLICRARRRFSRLLLREVAKSCIDPTDEQIEEELIELGLHHYCKTDLKTSEA